MQIKMCFKETYGKINTAENLLNTSSIRNGK